MIAAGVAAIVIVVGACGGSDSSPSGQESSTTTTTGSSTTTTLPPTSAVAAPACTPEALLPPVKAAMDRPDESAQGRSALQIARVQVQNCGNGYARVSAFAEGADTAEQVFLRVVDGHWEYIEAGTGINCHDLSGLTPQVQAACTALNLTG